MPDETITRLPVRENGVPLVPMSPARRPLAPSQTLTQSQRLAVQSMIEKAIAPLNAKIAALETKLADLNGPSIPAPAGDAKSSTKPAAAAKAAEKAANAPAASKARTPVPTAAKPAATPPDAKSGPPAGKSLPESNQEVSPEAQAIVDQAKDPDLKRALTSIAKRDQPAEVTLAQMRAALAKYQPDAAK